MIIFAHLSLGLFQTGFRDLILLWLLGGGVEFAHLELGGLTAPGPNYLHLLLVADALITASFDGAAVYSFTEVAGLCLHNVNADRIISVCD